MGQQHTGEDEGREPDTRYNSDVSEAIECFNEELERLQVSIALLQKLGNIVSLIDRDFGAANIEIENNVVTITTTTPGFSNELRKLVDEYAWNLKEDIGYDEISSCIQWELKAEIEHLIGAHNREKLTQC